MSSEIAIRVKALGKCYQIYNEPRDRLKQFVLPRLQRLLGRVPRQYFREFWALREVSFEVRKGETVGIVGRNGSGKSTLLQLVCGTLGPTQGEVEIHGRVAALLELGSGFNPEFSGRENVFMNGQLLGLSHAQVSERFAAIEAFADIGEFIEQPVKTYSSGMHVRLAFAVIAHVDADILVIDEALAVGDAYFTQKCMRFLNEFMKRGTVLFVSHDMASVKALAERSLWLEQGNVRQMGETKLIADAYLEALYGNEQAIVHALPATVEFKAEAQEVPKTERATTDEASASPTATEFVTDYRNPAWIDAGVVLPLQVFQFDPGASWFGDGGASIVDTRLLNREGRPVYGIYGGEWVCLEVLVQTHQALYSPIIGFFLRNRLGQNVFGDNSFFVHKDAPLQCAENSRLLGRFEFVMPLLPIGEYAFSVAIASGSNSSHVQHQWMHDALLIRSMSANVHADLFGMPMANISLEILAEKESEPIAS